MRRLIICLLTACMASISHAAQERFLNLGFERVTPGGEAWGWSRWGPRSPNYEFAVDTTRAYAGRNSFRIRRLSDGLGARAETVFPVEVARGARVRYSAEISTAGVSGRAGLWLRFRRADGTTGVTLLTDGAPTGTTRWKRYSIETNVPADATDLRFGITLAGDGTAWFDALRIELNGRPYPQNAAPTVPRERQLEQLMEHVQPLDAGLEQLEARVGAASIIGLGESTHGTHEFFEIKRRMVARLVEHGGFKVFAIEASMPEARLIDAYLATGTGDPHQLLRRLGFWTWNTQEFLDLLLWMRELNASGRGKITFWGIDCQMPAMPIATLTEFLKTADADGERELQASLATILRGEDPDKARAAAQAVLDRLLANRTRYEQQAAPDRVAWIVQSARLIRQSVDARYEPAARDRCMADNLEWVRRTQPDAARVLLWAHDDHLRASPTSSPTLGSLLRSSHGDDYFVFGFTFHEGTYNARGRDGPAPYPAPPSRPGSIEWALHLTRAAPLILDLRFARAAPSNGWLGNELDMRTIGAAPTEDQFVPLFVPQAFDALVYLESTGASTLLALRASLLR